MAGTTLYDDAVALLREMIRIPSPSRNEAGTADLVASFLEGRGIPVHRKQNNVWAFNKHYSAEKPSVLLNSHHDTVAPNGGYTRDPYSPDIEGGRLYGLGSNDAGASVVSLLATFLYFYDRDDLRYNLVVAITAEEEVQGRQGLECVLPELGPIGFAIVGEPTGMHPAIAERGLMVLDCVAHGRAGHAAREEGENAIYNALPDIEWFRTHQFPRKSDLFGRVKMSVTVIGAGTQHNVVPDQCSFVVDVRVPDTYTLEKVLEIIRANVRCKVTPRSLRIRPSYIPTEHPIVASAVAQGRKPYGSPTTSDQALIPVPSVKIGPGESSRSHSADEYVLLSEIEEGIALYIKILEPVISKPENI